MKNNNIMLVNFIQHRRKEILNEWAICIMAFTRMNVLSINSNDKFTDPLKFTVYEELDSLLGQIIVSLESGGKDLTQLASEPLMKILTLHSTPDKVGSIGLKLKNVIRDLGWTSAEQQEIIIFDKIIHSISANAQSLFQKNLELISQIKKNEIKSGVFQGLPPDAACPSKILPA